MPIARHLLVLRVAAVLALAALVGALLTPDAYAQTRAGFQDNAAYDRGPTDSVDVYGLNPIVSQPLSPALPISESLQMAPMAYYSGFSWSIAYQGVPAEPFSIYSRNTGSGFTGASWRLNPGHIWADIYTYVNVVSGAPDPICTAAHSVYVAPGGGEHVVRAFHFTDDGSFLDPHGTRIHPPEYNCWVNPRDYWITSVIDDHDVTTRIFAPATGEMISHRDRWDNQIDYTYMGPEDFQAIEPTATPAQWNFDAVRRHPARNVFATETIKAPKSMTDSMGRTIYFRYSLLPGYSKFLLTAIDVPTPNGRGTYRLSYQIRSITQSPPGWPAYAPNGPSDLPFLVNVELPEAFPETPRPSYNYDYDSYGELTEVRYPSGGRTVFEWADVPLGTNSPEEIYSRGIVGRRVYPSPGSPTVYEWKYAKATYPSGGDPILDRDRTIITDPAGNDTEYRFGSWPPELTGFPRAIRAYKGRAPRYRAGAQSVTELDPNFPPPGELLRSTSLDYNGQGYKS